MLRDMSQRLLPTYRELYWPTLLAVRSLGGSGTIGEINDAVHQHEQFTEEQQQVLLGTVRRQRFSIGCLGTAHTSRAWGCLLTVSVGFGV